MKWFSKLRPLTYSEGISVPKMANTVALHTQLASIMEVLANAAVAEICELVDNGYAVLHLEISRGQKENEALRRKLRLMDLKVSRGSTPRAGMGSSILAHRGARAHLGMESRRTSSCDVQCLRAVDSQLVTSQFGEGKSSGDAGHTTTQRKPAAFDDIKPKSPTIKEERQEEAWESHDQGERQSTEALNQVDGGEMHSAIDTEAAQPISKQENASSCIWTLKTHLRVHTGEKPFSCMQCGKCFSDSSNFKRHQSVHTGERRYGCSHCGKRFAQSGSLKDHLKVHTGCKQFRCPQCGKTFISANHLKRHIIVHNGERLLPTTFQ